MRLPPQRSASDLTTHSILLLQHQSIVLVGIKESKDRMRAYWPWSHARRTPIPNSWRLTGSADEVVAGLQSLLVLRDEILVGEAVRQ